MKNKIPLIIIVVAVIVSLGIFFLNDSSRNNTKSDTIKKSDFSKVENIQNTEIKDGIQYITINAKGGYSPRISNAKAGIPTKLIIKTNGTYDCSSSLSIRSIGYQKILSQTGEEIIDLGIPKKDIPIQGICGMGMYNFLINFN